MFGPDLQHGIDSYAVEWESLVTSIAPVREGDHAYLDAIAHYSNNSGFSDGITALRFDLAADAEFDRLLIVQHGLSGMQPELGAHLLARTTAAAALRAFAPSIDTLAARVTEAAFRNLSPFLVEGTLAWDLYTYGMYRHFYMDHVANEARDLARGFLRETVGDELEAVVALTTRAPWGDWFDPHSCTDRSWLLIGRRERRAWILAFSHSD